MDKVKVREAAIIVRAAGPVGVPVLLWGLPGIGKSDVVKQLGLTLDIPVEVVIGSTRTQVDFSGLPVVSADGSVHLAPPRWAQTLHDAGKGILFLDELTSVGPSVQGAMLDVALSRRVADLVLDNVYVVAAANPPEVAVDGAPLQGPMANRFLHLEVAPDHDGFAAYLSFGAEAAVKELPPPVVPTESEIVAAKSAVIAFTKTVGHFHEMPDGLQQGKAWPSPRTWDFVARVLPRLAPRHQPVAVAGLVGKGAASEFLSWRDKADLPDPEELLANPGKFAWAKARPDQVYVALHSVVTLAQLRGDVDTWSKAWDVLAAAAASKAADVAATAANALLAARPDGAGLPLSKMEPFRPMFEAAGMLVAA